jgi:predicted metalloprotease
LRWRSKKQSAHVEDRRGVRAGPKLAGGGIGLLLLVGVGLFLGVDASTLMQVIQTQQQSAPAPSASRTELEDEQAQFVAVVLADTEDTWNEVFRSAGRNYQEPPQWMSTHPANSTRIDNLKSNLPKATDLYRAARAAGKKPGCVPPALPSKT